MQEQSKLEKILFRVAVVLAVVAIVASYVIAGYVSRTTLLDCALDGTAPGAIRSVEIAVGDADPTSDTPSFLTVTIGDDPAFYADLLAIFETITVQPRLFKPGLLHFQRGEAYRFIFDIDGLPYVFEIKNKHNMSIYIRPNDQTPFKPYRIVKGENLPAIYDLLLRCGYIAQQ